MTRLAFGIDVGGSGVKGALVDLDAGEFAGERLRIKTPAESTPQAIAAICKQLVDHFQVPENMPVGVTIPGPVKHNVVPFMANLHADWEGTNVHELMLEHTGRQFFAVNDADAAGYAEVKYGAAKDVPGLVIVTTLGTGIGSALVMDGILVPNSELGHLELDGYDAETRASSSVKAAKKLGFKSWSKRLQRYYSHVEMLFSPELFVVGGGISKNHEKFLPLLDLHTPILPATLRNNAGIIGAAILAEERSEIS